MQRRFVLALVLSSLYWGPLALATGLACAQTMDEKPASSEAHIAVILPLLSSSYGKHAESVRLGILNGAANAPAGSPKVKIYATSEDPQQILAAYQRATSLGARAVIGPLTRNGVTALAQSGVVSVPTLALNTPEAEVALPRNLYIFGLQIEAEARQLAQYAFRPNATKAFVIFGDTPLDSRITQAFSDEWKSLGGEITGQFGYTTDTTALAGLRDQVSNSRADVIFTSLDAARARFVRSYLGTSIPIYATSMVFTSNTDALANYDLDGVRFLDMPWLLQPDHPAVISYSRPEGRHWELAQERFYALGIDAYRLVLELLRPYQSMEPLDGVTGTITLNSSHQFIRALVPAQFSQGSARMIEGAPNR